ncbi:hypothetical protein Q3G72_003717 [Acer saccharum]|nr:hypothetical protein Q3G72_003717 [Acer saccharum]
MAGLSVAHQIHLLLRVEDVEKPCAQKTLADRIAQMFNKNSDTATSKGVVDSLESPAVSDENCENQSSSDPFEQVMKIMESRDQEGEIPSNLLGVLLVDQTVPVLTLPRPLGEI